MTSIPDDKSDNLTREPNPMDVAAVKLQRAWRSRRKQATLDTDARWHDAVAHAKFNAGRQGAHEGKNDPRTRWRRAAVVAARLQDGQGLLMQRDDKVGVGAHGKDPMDKQLETQHWLELIDGKHRYGSNLKFYFRKWQADDTKDNFFRWLDYGEGKSLSLPECSREHLEKERIIYLSAEQRLNYLVKIDSKGKLRWARNNELVDTLAGHWKDLGNGMGIAPTDGAEPVEVDRRRRNSFSDWSTASSSQASHYAGSPSGNRVSKMLKSRFTTAGLTDRLLRKTVRRNTWIYCTDKHFNLFIGIKSTGSFQHSSFLSGGLVTSAGLITVQAGIIRSLSPLSGHYRTSIQHFRDFVEGLDERGAHLGKLKVSKAEGILWGLEHYGKFKKAKNAWMQKQKKHVKSVVKKGHRDKRQTRQEPVGERNASGDQESERRWKRDILHGRRGEEKVRSEEGAITPLKNRPNALESNDSQDASDDAEPGIDREQKTQEEEQAKKPEERPEEISGKQEVQTSGAILDGGQGNDSPQREPPSRGETS